MQRRACFRHLVRYSFLLLIRAIASSAQVDGNSRSIGAIVDYGIPSGRQEKTAMVMAVEDFGNSSGRRLALHVQDSRSDPVRAASIAMAMIKEQHVEAIIGPRTCQELAFIAELGGKAQIPVISFTNSRPSLTSEQWPFLVRVSRNQNYQMKAIAAIVQSWRWRWVSLIYEDTDFASTSIIPELADAIRNVGSVIDQRIALLPSSASFSQELEKLRRRECRVFIVHTTMELAIRLFAETKLMGMMEKEYVWIVTDPITNLLDSVNSSVIASMQGAIGVKNYVRPSARYRDFRTRFRTRLRKDFPGDKRTDPQVSALQAYDVAWALSMAMERTSRAGRFQNNSKEELTNMIQVPVYLDGPLLLESILKTNFTGLSGKFNYINGEFSPTRFFQIVNVIGKSYRELGFWSFHLGFSATIDGAEGHSNSMKILGQVYWPGGPWTVPKGWAPPTDENPLKIAVLAHGVFPEFVTVRYDSGHKPKVWGFSVNVFKETVKHLPYYLPYKFIPYNGTYEDLLEGSSSLDKPYDMLIGDTSISSGRYRFVEFSQPYTPSGLLMVVPTNGGSSRAWIFLKPFTTSLWALTAAVSAYNGVVVWMIERNFNTEFQGSVWSQIGTLFWLSFTTLLSPGEKLHSNLSRMAMVVWLFAALVLTSNYTASLSSLLTAQRLEPDLVTIRSLKQSNAVVGCNNGSVVAKYLEEVMEFQPKNIRKFNREDEYPKALKSGDIKAAFLRVPHANLLLAKYCMEFTTTGPVYHVGGLGFVFPKGSPLLSDISEALLQVFETGKIQELETNMLAYYNCSGSRSDTSKYDRLSPESFWGLFALTMSASTIALMLYGVFLRNNRLGDEIHRQHGMLACKISKETVMALQRQDGAKKMAHLHAEGAENAGKETGS